MLTAGTSTRQIAEPRLLLATTIAPTLRAFLLPLAEHFRQKGWRVDAMANGVATDDICRATFERVWEADWRRNPLYFRNLMMVSRIRDLAMRHKYDIVHVHTPIASFITRLALDRLRREQRLQVLYTAHGLHFHPMSGSMRNKVFETMERKAASWTDFLVVMNREDLKAVQDKQIIARDRLRFMPGIGVDRLRYSSASVSRNELRHILVELGIASTTPVLLVVAEFTRRKRHADVLRAFAKMAHPSAHLVLAGSGPLLEPMKRLAGRLGISDRVRFLGQRTDIPALMKASRALVLASTREGLPRCIMEAMSMGLPVIGSRIRGTTELLERNAGLLVDPGDIDQLACAMQSVLGEEAICAALGQAGRRQSEEYDLGHILRMHEDLYEEALHQRRSREFLYSPSSLVHA